MASWNILTPRFERQTYHPYVSAECRAWSFRRPMLVKRLLDLDADILCCQEAANEEMSLVSDLELEYTSLVPPLERKVSRPGIEKPVTFVRREKFEVGQRPNTARS